MQENAGTQNFSGHCVQAVHVQAVEMQDTKLLTKMASTTDTREQYWPISQASSETIRSSLWLDFKHWGNRNERLNKC